MKRLTLLLIFISTMSLEVEAQSWLQLLQNLFGGSSKSDTEEVERPKFISSTELLGEWFYASSEIIYEGSDPVAKMGVSALKSQAADLLAKVGVAAGRDKATFSTANRASLQVGEHRVEGNYSYDPKTGEVSLSIELGGRLHTLKGKTEYKDGALTLLFDAQEALAAMKEALPALAENDYVKVAGQIIEAYPGIKIGATARK